MSSLTNNTFQDILTLALKNAGVIGQGQTAGAEDMNDACAMLNDMIAQWQQKRYLIYHLIEQSFPCTGAQSYSIGPGGDVSVSQRPAAIKAAFARQVVPSVPNQVDYPIRIITSREDYSRIALKTLNSFPQWIWYDADVPLGFVIPYPIISNQFSLHLVMQCILQQVLNLTDTIVFPPEYRMALWTNLAMYLSTAYQTQVHPLVPGMAKASLETIRVANAQIPQMTMPFGISGRRTRWNIYSDNY